MGVISGPGCRDGFSVRQVIVERDQRQPVVCHEAEVTDDPEDTAINIVSVLFKRYIGIKELFVITYMLRIWSLMM